MDDRSVLRAVARELDVHVLAWNAGARLVTRGYDGPADPPWDWRPVPTPGVRYMKMEDCVFDGPVCFDWSPMERWSGPGYEDIYPLAYPCPPEMSAGWAAWYAVGDELR